MRNILFYLTIYIAIAQGSCDPAKDASPASIKYYIQNDKGMRACLTADGARLISLKVPASNGRELNIVLKRDNLSNADYWTARQPDAHTVVFTKPHLTITYSLTIQTI